LLTPRQQLVETVFK